MHKKIYILLATYNGEKYLREQLNSLFKQSYSNWLLWTHDDNSKDNTVEILRSYSDKFPDKIKFLDDNISCGGAKENFAYLLNKIDDNYDYIMFCDQDDVWLQDKIEVTLNKILEVEEKNGSKPILIHSDLKVVDEYLHTISDSMFKYQKLNLSNQYSLTNISIENIVTGCTMMLNKRLVQQVKNIPKEAIIHDWWISIIALKNKGIIEFVNSSTILYRQHSSNTIGSKQIKLSFYLRKIFSFSKIINTYKNIYKQYKKAGISISILYLILTKIKMIIKKIL
jgi:glycosyltransferase involved in cell wall biosynthesis